MCTSIHSNLHHTAEVQTLINTQTQIGLNVNWSSELAELMETEMV